MTFIQKRVHLIAKKRYITEKTLHLQQKSSICFVSLLKCRNFALAFEKVPPTGNQKA